MKCSHDLNDQTFFYLSELCVCNSEFPTVKQNHHRQQHSHNQNGENGPEEEEEKTEGVIQGETGHSVKICRDKTIYYQSNYSTNYFGVLL